MRTDTDVHVSKPCRFLIIIIAFLQDIGFFFRNYCANCCKLWILGFDFFFEDIRLLI